jgi:hypothetical protein
LNGFGQLRIASPESSRRRFHALKRRAPFHSSASRGIAAQNLPQTN